jgi:hypothetical protein
MISKVGLGLHLEFQKGRSQALSNTLNSLCFQKKEPKSLGFKGLNLVVAFDINVIPTF